LKSPRPFHGFFTGLKTGECSWAQIRRWTLAGYAGVDTYFTRAAGQKVMEGSIKILPVSTGTDKVFHSIESASRMVGSNIVLPDGHGGSQEFPIFSELVKALAGRYPDLCASNGTNVDDQTQSKTNGLFKTWAYQAGRVVPAPQHLTLTDPLAKILADQYQAVGNYAGNYILFDGAFDGNGLVVLDPSARSAPRASVQAVENQILVIRFRTNWTPEQAKILALAAGYNPQAVAPALEPVLGADEASRQLLGDAMNDFPASDVALAGLTFYRQALERFPGNWDLLSTRLLEGIEKNAITAANLAHGSYQAALEALDAALLSHTLLVTQYNDARWQDLIQSRIDANPRVRALFPPRANCNIDLAQFAEGAADAQ
jgi:hypothetical protein